MSLRDDTAEFSFDISNSGCWCVTKTTAGNAMWMWM